MRNRLNQDIGISRIIITSGHCSCTAGTLVIASSSFQSSIVLTQPTTRYCQEFNWCCHDINFRHLLLFLIANPFQLPYTHLLRHTEPMPLYRD